jgi:hypothetical protein
MLHGLFQELLNLQQRAVSRWVRTAVSGGETSQLIYAESYGGNGVTISNQWLTVAYCPSQKLASLLPFA